MNLDIDETKKINILMEQVELDKVKKEKERKVLFNKTKIQMRKIMEYRVKIDGQNNDDFNKSLEIDVRNDEE